MEIDAGKMAQQKGTTQAMKDYGAKLQRDHQAADVELADYATKSGIALSGNVPAPVAKTLAQAKDHLNALDKVNGQAFDRRFAEQMVQDHKGAIAMLDNSKPRITDPKLQALLGELEPTLQSHEQIAANLLSEMPGVSFNERAASQPTAQGRHRPGAR